MNTQDGILLGISSCLLGEEVRFNGGHKQSRYCLDVLSKYMEFQPFCPEVAIGLGIPREPIRLIGDPQAPRAVGTNNAEMDVTEALAEYAHKVADQIDGKVSGYLLMKNSPSCGMHRVKVYQKNGHPHIDPGRGVFAQVLSERLPLLPIEEEARLNDAVLRDNFITRVYTYYHWHQLLKEGLTPQGLIEFHARHKYLVMAHSQKHYKQLGQLLSNLSEDLEAHASAYFKGLIETLATPASRGNHTNVLMHLLGYLKDTTPSTVRQDILTRIEQYQQGELPLVVPITLLKHHVDPEAHPYLANQVYLQPHPEKLGLRNGM
ncbi:YbgA family protein [Pokkaliibacter sp. CJK22405]|uniref:YbgA family protein n=1 Tax=Pokkaliibacter sp. CJK22405 TaxID=3384615 RepID=UPI00398467BA